MPYNTGYRNSYNVRAFNAPYVVQQAAPLPPGGASGGGDGGGVSAPPLAASPFQRSVARERALNAAKAARFAVGAPLPMDENGNYNGAFGTGPAAEQAATAARGAYVEDQQNRADTEDFGEGHNFFTRRRFAGDANARANDESAARVERDRTFASTIAPATAEELRARANKSNVEATHLSDLTPGQVGLLEAEADQKRASGQAALAAPGMLKTQLDATTKQLRTAQSRIQFLEGKLAPRLGSAAAGGSRVDRLIDSLGAPGPLPGATTQPSDANDNPDDDPSAAPRLSGPAARIGPPSILSAAGTPAAPGAKPNTTAARRNQIHVQENAANGIDAGTMHLGAPGSATPPAAPSTPVSVTPPRRPTTRPTARKPTDDEVAQIKEMAGGDRETAIRLALERGLDPYAN